MAKIREIANNLKKTPIFNLSLSSKELFHSNFLYWLSLEYPTEVSKFFADLYEIKSLGIEKDSQKREENNIDFQFSYKDGTTVYFENKVKSMPIKNQLEKYSEKIKVQNRSIFILLSLTKPNFDSTLLGWKYLSYKEYNDDFLKKLKTKKQYHNSLIEDYTNLVDNLIEIEKICEVESTQTFDFHITIEENEDIAGNELYYMKELRLHDLFLKKKYENLLILLKNEINNRKIKLQEIYTTSDFKGGEDQIYFESGLTHSQGFIGFKYRLKGYRFLLVQLQGDSYRMGVEYLPPKKKDKPKESGHFFTEEKNSFDKLIEEYRKNPENHWLSRWLNFKNKIKKINKSDITIYPIDEPNGLNKFNDTFFYRYVKLGTELSIKDLIDLMLKDIIQAMKLKEEQYNFL